MLNERLNKILPQIIQNRIAFWVQLFMCMVSIVFLGAVTIDYGFDLRRYEMQHIYRIYNFTWWVYFIVFILRIFFVKKITVKKMFMTSFLGGLLLLSAIPKFWDCSGATGFWEMIFFTLQHKYFVIGIISILSIWEVSTSVVGLIDKKTNPALLMASAFLVVIVIGAFLLLLPRSTCDGVSIPIIDALFVSTSAVCVTGLSSVDVSTTFSIEGQIVLMALIQIGGLGVMTITSFFAMFFMGNTGLYNQFALRDMLGTGTFNSLISTLFYILGFTFVIELGGAVCIWLSVHSTMGMSIQEELFFSIFHSISAFCNAGFSTLQGNLGNPLVISGHNWFYVIISFLIIFGGIGFPILVNLKTTFWYYIKNIFKTVFCKRKNLERFSHVTNINTKIVLAYTFIFIVVGTALLAFFEWNNAFASMPVVDKLVHSFFNAVAPRTAGFNSVDLTSFSMFSLLVYLFFMWVGGSSQSTAGGIKMNTFAVSVANLVSVLKGRQCVILFNREISSQTVRRASAILFGSIGVIFIFFFALMALEPNISPWGLLFETVSALGTVGSSLNVTAELCEPSKALVVLLMFIGRVGLITILMSFFRQEGKMKFRYPKDDVIIN